MCSLASGAHNLGLYTLNYDIDYSDINYPSTGPQASLAQYNGINCFAVGFPYDNLKRLAAPAPAARRGRGGCGTRGPGATGRVHPTSFTTLYLGLEPMAELRIWRRSCYYFCERTAELRRRWSHHYILRRRCGFTHLDGGGPAEGRSRMAENKSSPGRSYCHRARAHPR